MESSDLAVANKAMEQMRAMLTEFGVSPSSRTRAAAWAGQDLGRGRRVLRLSRPAEWLNALLKRCQVR